MTKTDRDQLVETIEMISVAIRVADASGQVLIAAHLSIAMDCAQAALASLDGSMH